MTQREAGEHSKNEFVTRISVEITEYLGNENPVKKTLTIPTWADKAGREMKLNFSQNLN